MPSPLSRRSFLHGSTVLGLSFAGMGLNSRETPAAPDIASQPFMDQYYRGIIKIVSGIRDTQTANIARAMETAYACSRNGGTIYSNQVFGHYAAYAGCRGIPGQPWVLPQYYTLLGERFKAMKKGDFLLTNIVNMDMKTGWNEESDDWKKAHDRGVFIAGVTSNYFKNYRTPPGAYYPKRMELALEDISSLIIDSQTPWDNGLVSAPQHPQFKICPSTGIAQFAVYWACTASLANLIGSKGKGSAEEPAKKYLDLALERFRMVEADRPKIDSVAKQWTDLVLGKKARLFVFGESFQVGDGESGNMFVADAVGAANGSMIARGYNTEEVRKDDIVLIGSVRSNQPREMEVAREAREKGAHTVAFCPFSIDGYASGPRLFKEVDNAFNTYADEKAGVISVPGFVEKVSPIAGLTGNLVHWMLMAQWADNMARRGEMPYFWQGMHETGGMEYDEMVRPYFEKRGY